MRAGDRPRPRVRPLKEMEKKGAMLGAIRRTLGFLFVGGLLVGCSEIAADSPLTHAYTSPEALAEAALTALADRDDDALRDLMITREEYETLLWPSMPDREHMPFDFVWSVTGPRSRKARREALDRFGGLPMELVRIDLGDEVERYEGFALHKGATMTVRRADTGEEGSLPLIDVLVEMGGGWKFMNFVE